MENNENNVQNQGQKKKETKGISAPLVIIMLVAVLIIGIGGGYLLSKNDQIFNKHENQTNNTNNAVNNTAEQTKTSKKIDENKPWVYDAEYGKNKTVKKIDTTNNSDKDLVVPYININSTAGKKANTEIEKLYNEIYEKYATDINESAKNFSRLNYKFYENNNVLSIIIENSNGAIPGGAGRCPLYVYNFNLDTLEIATNEELAKQTGYNSIAEVNEIVNKWITKEKTDEEIEESAGTITGLVKDTYFIDGNNNLNFVYTVAAAGTYDCYMTVDKAKEYIATTKNNTNTQQTQATSNANSTTVSDNASNEKILYTYSSGDNAAANGNGEHLYVYEMNNNIIRFKYHTPWSTNDISGTATKISQDLYVYEKDNYKIEILLNAMGENSVKVSEYNNGTISSWKNLWK